MTEKVPSDEDVGEIAREIVEESAEMGDYGPLHEVEGTCVVCGADATWQSPSDEYYCQEHASKHFRERHG